MHNDYFARRINSRFLRFDMVMGSGLG